jgi:hypothetical protein
LFLLIHHRDSCDYSNSAPPLFFLRIAYEREILSVSLP